MSEREFLELLNLYLDREITAADADRLEREIRSDAGRHRTYLQYCRMQQAVRLLGNAEGLQIEERSLAGRAPALSAVREWWGSRWVWTGAVAAAAVVLLFIAARRPESASAHQADRLVVETLRQDPGTGGKQPTLGLSGDALLLSQFPSTGSVPQVHEDQFNWCLWTRGLGPSRSRPPPLRPSRSPRRSRTVRRARMPRKWRPLSL